MSAAEMTARKFYEDYHIGMLTDDVQRYLIILMLSNKDSQHSKVVDYGESMPKEQMPPQYAAEEIHSRIAQAEKDILSGNTTPTIEMEARLESKYPWLCK